MGEFASGPTTICLGDRDVCRLGFGAMQLPGPMVWGEPKDPDQARAVLRRAVALGINLIDTSWYYGPHVANRLIVEALHPYPSDLVIATKLGGRRTEDKGWAASLRPDELRVGCEEDLRSLKLEQIHMTHLRWIASAGVPFAESLDAMISLQREGKIRHLAVSNVTFAQLEVAVAKTPIVSVQNLYNVAAGAGKLRGFPHAVVDEQELVVDFCAVRRIAFLPFFPLALPGPPRETPSVLVAIAERHKVSVAQIAIAWLLARASTMLPIPGTSSLAHLDENWNARRVELTPNDFSAIADARQ